MQLTAVLMLPAFAARKKYEEISCNTCEKSNPASEKFFQVQQEFNSTEDSSGASADTTTSCKSVEETEPCFQGCFITKDSLNQIFSMGCLRTGASAKKNEKFVEKTYREIWNKVKVNGPVLQKCGERYCYACYSDGCNNSPDFIDADFPRWIAGTEKKSAQVRLLSNKNFPFILKDQTATFTSTSISTSTQTSSTTKQRATPEVRSDTELPDADSGSGSSSVTEPSVKKEPNASKIVELSLLLITLCLAFGL